MKGSVMESYITNLKHEIHYSKNKQIERVNTHLKYNGNLSDFANSSAEWHLEHLWKAAEMLIKQLEKEEVKKKTKKKFLFWKK